MARQSPFAAPTIDLAYEAWCSMVLPLRKGRGETARKPAKATWIKKNQARYDEFQQAATAPPLGQDNHLAEILRDKGFMLEDGKLVPYVNEEPEEKALDIEAIVAAAVADAVAKASGTPAKASPVRTTKPDPKYRKRHTKAQRHDDAARGQILWALNDEGLIREALLASPNGYITQDAAQRTMTAAFGPLVAA